MKINIITIALFTLLAFSCSTTANTWKNAKLNTHISQGYTRSTDNNFHGNSEKSNGSFAMREFGLNASTNLSSSLFAAGQILARNTGQDDDEDLSLDYALIDYTHSPAATKSFGFRLGRIKNPLGFYNETRDVAFTRPSVILPQSIYFDRTRDLSLSADGLHVYSKTQFNTEITLGLLEPRIDKKSTTTSLLGSSASGELESNTGNVWNITHEQSAFTLTYSGAALELDYNPPTHLNQSAGSIKFLVNILSFQYDNEFLSITSEYADRRFKFHNLETLLPYKKLNGESYYLQLTAFISPRLKSYIRYDVLYSNKDDRSGKKFEQLTLGTRPRYSQFAKDWTLGIRWHINRHWMINLEHHWIDGTAWLPIQNNPIPNETERKWRLFAAIISFRY